MSLNQENIVEQGKVDRIIGRVTILIRVALAVCVLISFAGLIISPFSSGEPDNIGAFFFFAVFYSIIWGTVPSMCLLMAITLDNRYRSKLRLQPTRTEFKLLIANVIILLVTIAIVGLIRINEQ